MATKKDVRALTFLTEREQDALTLFIQNETMREALYKVLMDGVNNMGVQRAGEPSLMNRNWVFGMDPQGTLDDDKFGRAIRVHTAAFVLVEQAFKALYDLVPTSEETSGKNPAL